MRRKKGKNPEVPHASFKFPPGNVVLESEMIISSSYVFSIFPPCPQVRVSLTPHPALCPGRQASRDGLAEFLCSLTSGWT